MHICTYFCVLGPFGTHPPLVVQKYTSYFCVLGENSTTHPQNGTFVQKNWQNRRFFQKFLKKIQKKFKKIWRIFQKKLGNFQEFFNENWENFRLFFPKLDLFLQFFGIFYENFVQKYQLYFCDFGKNVDTHPWLYKSTLYTFVFWVPSGPTPPHTRRVLLYLPPGPRESGIAIIIGQGAGNERSECA